MSTHPTPDNPPADTGQDLHEHFAGALRGKTPAAARGRQQVPDAIEKRYLRIGNRYFFPDRTLAFIDDGARIRVKTENREVLQGVAAIAQARGWQVIEIKGTESFRQGMWHEAALRGIAVRGHEPTGVEILQIERAREKRQRSREAAIGQDGTSLREDPRAPVRGVLMAAAAAPYQFDPAQRMSFHVRIRTEVGDRTLWGADLERALAESKSQPRIGDPVELTRHGTQPVTVRVPSRNAQGELIGEKKIAVQRARWRIETTDHLQAMARHTERVRNGERLPDQALAEHVELAAAAAGLQLAGQFARRVTTDRVSQHRLVQLIRDRMAQALEQGLPLHMPGRRLHPTPVHVRQRTDRSREPPGHERP